ncbi:MAG TPA: metalloregulator ArsR/SmtB family transcription factor [Steroidobacteraceae bacterium]|nr:metalloregulator ArsR/SmtB family transcription factor [Steroidobacteraceae bacterium]
MNIGAKLHLVGDAELTAQAAEARLDALFFALSDPVRRRILERLDGEALLVSELAEPFDITLQAVSRHIQVLVRAGLIQQERSGRISRCSLDAAPLLDAAVWINRYSKYWQQQFDMLAATLADIDERGPRQPPRKRAARRAARRKT